MPKIAVVTGGNRGLGRATALSLADAGTDVVLTYREHAEEAAAVVEEIRAAGALGRALRLDTSVVAGFAEFFETLQSTVLKEWGRRDVDVLVNNAGHFEATPLGSTDEATFDRLVDVHVKGVFFLVQTLAPFIADDGRVVLTSSGLSRFTGSPEYSVYASAKGAVDVMTRYLATALGSRRITVNAIAPGPVGTDFGGGGLRDDEQVRASIAETVALGRVGEPADIGSATALLVSDGAGWITGQRVEASGGTLL